MATIDLRCGSNLHGRLTDGRWLEVKCKRRACGYAKGIVILHTFDLQTGKLVSTHRFAEPIRSRKDQKHEHTGTPAPVRSP